MSHYRTQSERGTSNDEESSGHHYRGTSAGANTEIHPLGNNGSGSRPIPIPRANFEPNAATGTVQQLKVEVERLRAEQSDLRLQIQKKEQTLNDREYELNLKESNMESDYKDKKYALDQRERDLQLRDDQLHMKNKDLEHKEFDLMNADESTQNNSSSQFAEVAERQYELNRQQQELRAWALRLEREDSDITKRWNELLCREATPQQQQQRYGAEQQQQRYEAEQRQHYGAEQRQHYRAEQQQHYGADQQQQQQQQHYKAEQQQHYGTEQQHQQHYGAEHTSSSSQLPNSPKHDAQGKETNQPQSYTNIDSPDLSSREGDKTSTIGTSLHDLSDLELAQKMEDDEIKARQTRIYTDEMIALALQQEQFGQITIQDELSSHVNADEASGGAASSIKKELSERLTEDQRRKKQEDEDFLLAQRLSTANIEDDAIPDQM